VNKRTAIIHRSSLGPDSADQLGVKVAIAARAGHWERARDLIEQAEQAASRGIQEPNFDWKEQPLADTCLSQTTINLLDEAGYVTLGDLAMADPAAIVAISSIGLGRLWHIVSELRRQGLTRAAKRIEAILPPHPRRRRCQNR